MSSYIFGSDRDEMKYPIDAQVGEIDRIGPIPKVGLSPKQLANLGIDTLTDITRVTVTFGNKSADVGVYQCLEPIYITDVIRISFALSTKMGIRSGNQLLLSPKS